MMKQCIQIITLITQLLHPEYQQQEDVRQTSSERAA